MQILCFCVTQSHGVKVSRSLQIGEGERARERDREKGSGRDRGMYFISVVEALEGYVKNTGTLKSGGAALIKEQHY